VRLLIHVLTHIYRSHWQHLVELQLHPHFNTLVYHVMAFSKQFDLIDTKDSDVLEELFERLRRHCHTLSLSSPIMPTPEVTEVIAADTQLLNAQPQQPAAAVHNSAVLSS